MFHLARSVSVGLVLLAACVCGAAAVAANCPFYTTDVGDFKLTVVSDGAGVVFGLKDLVKDVHPSALQQVEKLHALKGPQKLDFNVVYLDTGAHKILFDVGSAEHFGPDFGKLLENMGKAGLDPKDVDTVVISHAYRDHIGGVLTPDGKIAFPNAKYMMAKVEHDYWTDPSLESAPTKPSGLKVAKKSIKAIKEKLQLFEFGDEILPGITSKALIGQTPGQSGFVLRSGNDSFIVTADAAIFEFLNVEQPEWSTILEIEPGTAVDTRLALFNEMVDSGMRGAFYHFTFPGIGNIYRTESGFGYHPIRYN